MNKQMNYIRNYMRPGVSWDVLGYPGVSWGNQTDPFLTLQDEIYVKGKVKGYLYNKFVCTAQEVGDIFLPKITS